MIPDTFGTILTFLAFVAPGLLFELLREQRRPATEESTFREASRIALASLAFTLTALLLMLGVRQLVPQIVADPSTWLVEGHLYLKDHFSLAMISVLVELVIAMSLTVTVDSLLRRSPHGSIRGGGVWFHQFRVRCPNGATPWLHVRLADETEIWGFLVLQRHFVIMLVVPVVAGSGSRGRRLGGVVSTGTSAVAGPPSGCVMSGQ
jgi:hypothetical protein